MSSSRVLHSQIISAIIHCTRGFDKAIRVLLTESLSLILFPFIAIKLLLSSKNSGCGKWYSCIVLRIVGIPHRPDWKNWTANHINVWDIPGLHSLSVGVSHLSFWINSNFSSNSFVVILVLPIFLYRITIFCVRNSNFISRTQKGTQIIRVPFWVPSYEYHPALNDHTD